MICQHQSEVNQRHNISDVLHIFSLPGPPVTWRLCIWTKRNGRNHPQPSAAQCHNNSLPSMISIVQIHFQLAACKLWTLEQAIQRFVITIQHLPFLSSRYRQLFNGVFLWHGPAKQSSFFFFLCNVVSLSIYFQSCIDECLNTAYCKGLREWYKRRR